MPRKANRRRVCFVTGTRAEFGLMESTLRAVQARCDLDLQLIVTGTHTHASRGMTVDEIRRSGWKIDSVIHWRDSSVAGDIARETGRVAAEFVDAFQELRSDIVLVVGDRVEAFAAASAGHLSGRIVAHVHGGDRAMGQADDSLRHAITKLAHLHLAATRGSADRIFALGEERSRIKVVGAPGIDAIRALAASRSDLRAAGLDYVPGTFALVLLHPTEDAVERESKRTTLLFDTLRSAVDGPVVALLPNNDPGADGIVAALNRSASSHGVHLYTHASRRLFLGLMRDCRFLIGNSSAGIIEAGSFRTPVVNIGPRQQGRERGSNVVDAAWTSAGIRRAITLAMRPRTRAAADNPYDRGGAGSKIAAALARVPLDSDFRRKLIRY